MKRGKNNKAKLGVSLLSKVKTAEAIVLANTPKPVRASGKLTPIFMKLWVLNKMRFYILKTKVKNLNPKIILGYSDVIKLIMSGYSYGQNTYHEELSVDNAFIPEAHKEEIQNETGKE